MEEVSFMDNTALYKLSYGVFMLSTTADGKSNGCITNTAIQVASNPTRIAIACINANYTCDLIKKSGVFTLSLLDETTTFDLIRHFGMQSGRDVDKIAGQPLKQDAKGLYYLTEHTTAYISATVVDSMDLGSHTLFIATVDDAELVSGKAPLTYADYQSKVKPKPEAPKQDRKIKGWRCKICGYIYEGSELPADYKCPVCGHPADDFEPIYE